MLFDLSILTGCFHNCDIQHTKKRNYFITEYTEYAVKKVIEFKNSLFKSNVNAFS